jgi:PAP2 superfamily
MSRVTSCTSLCIEIRQDSVGPALFSMRRAEWISLIAFSFFIVASWFRALRNRRRVAIVVIGAIGILLISSVQFAGRLVSPFAVSVVRDWLPAALMPMVYWQAGWFSSRVNKSFQARLQRLDQTLLGGWMASMASRPSFRWAAASLELAYISCYVLVPMGLGVLYLEGLQRHTTDYWSVVLFATYPCYVFTAFSPTHPPRLVETDSAANVTSKIRIFNLWIVRSLTTELNTFPSAHVTATLGGSLVLLYFLPAIGLVFVLVSIGIALGAVLGRYHYAADVIVAAALTLAVFALEIPFN